MLLTIMALGAVVSLTAVNGVFAVFTDRATTGTNSATSRAEAASADLQIATASYNPMGGSITCGATYVDDLASGVITVTDMAPNSVVHGTVCIKNAGSRSVDVTASVIDLSDTDSSCTGDESALDATCGPGTTQEGELSPKLRTDVSKGCMSASFLQLTNIAAMASTAVTIQSMSPGQTVCLDFAVQDNATGDDLTITQSDTATWKFAFDATAT